MRPEGWLTNLERDLHARVGALERTTWLPIDTAPKYTAVLVSDGRSISVAERCMGEWYALVGGETVQGSSERLLTISPTHWMPLPKPPGGSAAQH